MVDVTIVMPAYNVENYIEASIESVLKQSFEDWELIIVNDGSTDKTQEIIEKYEALDARIKLVNQENGGVSSARNKGLALALGKYISFLDSDDIYHSDYIKLMSRPIKSDIADMTFCKFQERDGERILLESPKDVNQLYNDSFIEHITNIKNANHSMGMMYRRSLITEHKVRFNEQYSYGEDLEFVLTMVCFSRIVFVPHYLYSYIFRGESLSRRNIPYSDLLGELDSLYRLSNLVKKTQKIDEKAYLEYIKIRERGTLNNMRRYYWQLLKSQKFEQLSQELESFKLKYGKKFNVNYVGLKKITNSPKLRIIRSQSRLVWKVIAMLPF